MNEVLRSMVITPIESGCRVRAAVHSATSSSDMITPPCAVPRLLVSCGSIGSDSRAVPLPSSSVWILQMLDERDLLLVLARVELERVSYDGRAAVDRDRLAGDVARGFGGEQHREALQVLVAAEAARRRPFLDQLAGRCRAWRAVIFDGKKPGQMAFTVMPCTPHSAASWRVRPTRPCLVAV